MVLDGHIHIFEGQPDPLGLARRLGEVGIDGSVLTSMAPSSFLFVQPHSAVERLENLFAWCGTDGRFFPFFWIDPLEDDALDQVRLAVRRGVRGFKAIHNRCFPGDERALAVYRAIAAAGKPILFHSGILWDGQATSKYNRPAEFEALLEVPRLRFALAHISWPWTDECIAVYGKFLSARQLRQGLDVEMFIDLTPGTPVGYRREVLTRLFTTGYDVGNNVLFGSDSHAADASFQWARQWIDRDRSIYADLGLDAATIDGIFGGNLRRFVGLAGPTGCPQPVPPTENTGPERRS